jgi:pimeloyl-ACP methyl ester carboxylesterase
MAEIDASLKGQYAQANGLNIYYEKYGSGEPLLLLHGGTMTSKSFGPLIPTLAEHFQVIAPDLRGHGQTINPSEKFSYRLLADDIAAFIETLGLDRPLICGYSDGGQIALELGMHYPNQMRCMVVGAAWFKFSDSYIQVLQSMSMESPGKVNIDKLKQGMPQMVGFWQSLHSPTHSSDYWETLLTQISTMWFTPLNYTAEDFQKIKIPTLILIGDRDPVVPVEEVVEMYRSIAGAELALLPQSDHSLPIARVELFQTIVLDFLTRYKDK